jgi:hypothetical protein
MGPNFLTRSVRTTFVYFSRLSMRFVCAILFVLAFDIVADAQEQSFKITGVVKQLDLKGGTISIRRKSFPEDEKFSFLKKDIDVSTPSGPKAKVDTIKIGQTVILTIGMFGDVEAVTINATAFNATVADIDLGKRTIKVAQNDNESAVLSIAENAKLSITGKAVYLREIKPGSEMAVSTSLDGKTVLGLNLLSDPDGKYASKLWTRVKVSRLPGTRYVGELSDIDPVKNELRLTGPKTKFIPWQLSVAKDASIHTIYSQVPIQPLALKDIGKKASATVIVSAANLATHIIVTPPTQRARVKALDGEAGRLTVEVEGQNKSYLLPRGVKIMNGTRVMRLGDLESNLAVNLVFSIDREQLLAVDMKQTE